MNVDLAVLAKANPGIDPNKPFSVINVVHVPHGLTTRQSEQDTGAASTSPS
jgi:hypothetical protein